MTKFFTRIGRTSLSLVLIVFCAALFAIPAIAQSPKGRNALQSVQDRHRERFHEFETQINKVADFCDEKKLTDAALFVRSRVIIPEAQSHRVDKLPAEVRPEIPVGLPADERHWQTQLRRAENDYARDLFIYAKSAANKGFPSYAYNLVREAALHDPDHVQVRRILGYVRMGNEWVTPFAKAQDKENLVWHEEFGWLKKAHVNRYIAGERYIAGDRNFEGRWVSAEKEKELRREFSAGWVIRTDHYEIQTNVSLERGVEMGKALEDFYGVFNETFSGFFNTSEQLQKLFDGSAKGIVDKPKPYRVHFYRTRDEYLNRLRKYFPTIDQTNGVYMTHDNTAHFYYDPNRDHEGTLFHEATHQLFFESHKANRTIGDKHHFWIIEGIACYMESFQRKDGSFSLGDPKYIRFEGARHNLLKLRYYVPLQEFSGYGMYEFQNAPEVAKNYTQAAGLARFFMHHDNGRYREALVKHLTQLYSGDARTREHAASLDELTGVDFADLDRQYADDARQTGEEVSAR